MCDKCGCTKPEEKKDVPCDKFQNKPKECTPEQIAKCHPESKDHPCEGEKEEPKQDA